MTEDEIIRLVRRQLEELGYSRESIVEHFEFSPDIRADLVVLNEDRKPKIIAEIKTFHLPLGRSQLERYLNKSRAGYGLLTDGKVTYCYARLGSGEIIEIPRLPGPRQTLDSVSKTPLKSLTDFSYKFWRIADVLRSESISPQVQLKELLKIILCKYVDESDNKETPLFRVSDPSLSDWQESTKSRIGDLFENAKRRYPDLFDLTERLELSARAISSIVGELQNYYLAGDPASLSRVMTELQERMLRSGEYSTPARLVKLLIELLRPSQQETVLDLACGDGNLLSGFLKYGIEYQPPDLRNAKASKLFGIEINSGVALFAKVNMIIQGNGSENILLGDALARLPSSPRLHEIVSEGGFDIVVVDPPLGGRITSDKYTEDYQLASGRSIVNAEVLFLERAIQLARFGGRIAIVVPEGLLFAEHLKGARDFIQEKTRVLAIISLPIGILMPYASVKINLLILEKTESKHEYADHKVFIADAKTDENLAKVPDCFSNERLNPPWVLRMAPSQLGSLWSVNYHLAGPAPTHGRPLIEFAEIKRGVSIPSSLYGGRSKDTIAFIRISDLFEGTLSSTSMKYVPRQKARPDAIVKTNDVLFSIAGTLAKVGVVPRNLAGALASSQVAILRPKKLVEPEYLSLVLSSRSVREQIKRFETGAFIRHLPIRELKNIRLVVPSLTKQKESLRKIKRLRDQYKHSTVTFQQIQQEIERLKEAA